MAVGPSVLLLTYVEDERELYGDALREAGFDVTLCSDPLCVLDEIIKKQPVALVTRILQPGFDIDGVELTRRIRQDNRTKHIRVVVVTSLVEPRFRRAAIEAGCDAFLPLPVLPDDVVGTVRRLIAPQPAPEEPPPAERRRSQRPIV
jgi:CheY-like chemotaxis protein